MLSGGIQTPFLFHVLPQKMVAWFFPNYSQMCHYLLSSLILQWNLSKVKIWYVVCLLWTFQWLPAGFKKKRSYKFACFTDLSFPFLPRLSLPTPPHNPWWFLKALLPLSFLLLLPVPGIFLPSLNLAPCDIHVSPNVTSSLAWEAHFGPCSQVWIRWPITCPDRVLSPWTWGSCFPDYVYH